MDNSSKPASPQPTASAVQTKIRIVALLALVAGIVLLSVGVVFWMRPVAPTAVVDSGVMRVPEGTAIGGPFQLVDHHGRAVSEQDFAGKFMLIFFGFTHCPDVCPTELQVMANAMDVLGSDGANVVPTFISVDPERDTPAQIKDYVAAFHPKLVGLTGTVDQVAAVAKTYKVYFAKQPSVGGSNEYQVDHTAFVYLMGPDGVLRSMFRSGASAEAIAGEIRNQLRRKS